MKKLVSLVISVAILALIYWKIGPENRAELLAIFRRCDPLWMVLSLGMVVPLTLFTSWRLQQLMPTASSSSSSSPAEEKDQAPRSQQTLGFGEANKLILVASVLNLVLPSKMGDIAKAWFMRDRSGLSGSLALSLVVFEKSCDMLSLLLWCVFGLAIYPEKNSVFWLMTTAVAGMLLLGCLLLGSKAFAAFFFRTAGRFAPEKMGKKLASLANSWSEMHDYFWSSKRRLLTVTITSVFIWFLHLLQIWMFILALRASVPFVTNLALSPLAILAGLLPIPTFGGAGTRDGALVVLYAPYFAAPVALALGLLCTARYLLPAIGGLPFAGEYLARAKTMKKSELANQSSG
ncbi:MAG TPA: lysylphosphatidylglycerol synthase transmembrane domain-containing protein [Chthoniobacteraceae bacterium]|jgi:hypothetical protein